MRICIGRKVIHTKSLNRRGKLINNGDETQQNMYTKIYATPVKALPLGFLFPEENKWILKILEVSDCSSQRKHASNEHAKYNQSTNKCLQAQSLLNEK